MNVKNVSRWSIGNIFKLDVSQRCTMFIFLGQICGLLPWNLYNERPKSFWLDSLCSAYQFALLLFHSVLTVYFFIPGFSNLILGWNYNHNDYSIAFIQCAISCLWTVINFIIFYSNKDSFAKLIRSWKAIHDLALHAVKEDLSYLKLLFLLIVPIVTFAILDIVSIDFGIFTRVRDLMAFILITFSNYFLLYPFVLFIFSVNLCVYYFEGVNKKILKIKMSQRQLEQNFSEIYETYQKLYKLVHVTQQAFGLPTLLSIVLYICYLCFTPYTIIFPYYIRPSTLMNAGFLILNILQVWIVVTVSDNLAKEALKGVDYLYECGNQPLTKKARFQILMLTQRLVNRPVEFTACGFFVIKKGLLTTIFSVAVTYLVILVQFRPSSSLDVALPCGCVVLNETAL